MTLEQKQQRDFNERLKEILRECHSIEEAKLKLALNNVSYSSSELGFVKWFWNLIYGKKKADSAKVYHGILDDCLFFRCDFKKALNKYIEKNIDLLVDEKKFRNLLNAKIAQSIQYDRTINNDNRLLRKMSRLTKSKTSTTNKHLAERLRKKRIWARHDSIKITALSNQLLKAYYSKHGLRFS